MRFRITRFRSAGREFELEVEADNLTDLLRALKRSGKMIPEVVKVLKKCRS